MKQHIYSLSKLYIYKCRAIFYNSVSGSICFFLLHGPCDFRAWWGDSVCTVSFSGPVSQCWISWCSKGLVLTWRWPATHWRSCNYILLNQTKTPRLNVLSMRPQKWPSLVQYQPIWDSRWRMLRQIIKRHQALAVGLKILLCTFCKIIWLHEQIFRAILGS